MSLLLFFQGTGSAVTEVGSGPNRLVMRYRPRTFVLQRGRGMSERLGTVYKDVDEAIAYTVDATAALNTATISNVTWTVPAGLTNQSTSTTLTAASIRLGGGTPGQHYTVECTLSTTASEILQGHFLVTVTN